MRGIAQAIRFKPFYVRTTLLMGQETRLLAHLLALYPILVQNGAPVGFSAILGRYMSTTRPAPCRTSGLMVRCSVHTTWIKALLSWLKLMQTTRIHMCLLTEGGGQCSLLQIPPCRTSVTVVQVNGASAVSARRSAYLRHTLVRNSGK